MQELWQWSESERISYQILKGGLAVICVINTKGNSSIIYVQIAENLLPARNVKMKRIIREILPNTNAKNYKIIFKMEIQKQKYLGENILVKIAM